MIPVFISNEGVVLDFTKPKTPTPQVAVQPEESFDQMAARSAEQQSTPNKMKK
jgi:hypothetical protein